MISDQQDSYPLLAGPNVVPVLAPSQADLPLLPTTTVDEKVPVQPLKRRAEIERVRVWGTDFGYLTMPKVMGLADEIVQLRKPEYFVTANLNYLMLVEDCPRLEDVNERAAAILADGQPIVTRSQFGPVPLPCRVTGADMVVELARLAATRGYRVFFLGGAPGVAQAAADHLQREFPTLEVAGCLAPPFRTLTSAEHADMLRSIRDAGTDILLVAFGQPKGEIWIYNNLLELGVPLSVQIGASFDFLAGTARRSPQLWQKFGCEWLYRALSDPMRLVPRYSRNALFLVRRILADLVGRCEGHDR